MSKNEQKTEDKGMPKDEMIELLSYFMTSAAPDNTVIKTRDGRYRELVGKYEEELAQRN